MKGILKMTVLAVALVAWNGAQAQEKPSAGDVEMMEGESNLTPEERARKRTDRMKAELALTDSQEKEIYDINLAHIIEMEKLRTEQQALREKIKAERESAHNRIKGVLTPEQNVLFDQKVAERQEKKQQQRLDNKH